MGYRNEEREGRKQQTRHDVQTSKPILNVRLGLLQQLIPHTKTGSKSRLKVETTENRGWVTM